MIENTLKGSTRGGQTRILLAPNRSLSRRGFLLLMTLFGVISFACGVAFALIGAWPVLGFFGLDVLIVYVAFRLNYRDGRHLELIDIGDEELSLHALGSSGGRRTWVFNPYWTRVALEPTSPVTNDLRIGSHGEWITFGRFLSEEEKVEVADLLGGLLAHRRGFRG
ncbi:MAG: DUF2244 domain-containing protein [Rhizobiales bacterium]|nr:DUF2244 domain-containing protein [Hyphomicrobiales bacterium]